MGEELIDVKNSLSQFADDAAIWRRGTNLPFIFKRVQQQFTKYRNGWGNGDLT